MIRIQLNEKQRRELEKYRGQSLSNNSEKAFMALLNSEGSSTIKIGRQLRRNPHTVRTWLKRYIQYGLSGLDRKYSEGRSREKRINAFKLWKKFFRNPYKNLVILIWYGTSL